VNGKPSPCECTEDVVCAYCVQANLVLWEKEEEKKRKQDDPLIGTIRKLGISNIADRMGINRSTVHRWVKTKRIPEKHRSFFFE
jgi:hypothetical protein